jgi:microcystin degradation protein MlrC
VLEHLLQRKFENVLVAGIADPPATDACYQGGEGATLSLSIGASLDPQGSRPVSFEAKVVFLLQTKEQPERQAVVSIDGVTVVLTARRRPFHYIRDFTRLGLSIEDFAVLVVKSGYLSPELAPLANPNLMALSDGAINQDIEGLPANRFRRPTFPFDRTFSWKPQAIVSARFPK